MFDPKSVAHYKIFWGEAVSTMRSFRPGRIHFIYAAPGLNPILAKAIDGIDDFDAFCSDFLFQSCRLLHEHGSIVMPRPTWLTIDADIKKTMSRHGMLFHDDLPDMMHFTKSTSFYSGFESEPLEEETPPPGRKKFDPVRKMDDALCCAYAPPGGIVMDPTAGTGSILAAAILRGRRAIGIDKSLEYAATASLRMARCVDPASGIRVSCGAF